MRLSQQQIDTYRDQGFLQLDGVFDPSETAMLMAEARGILDQRRPEIVREKDGETARTAFAAHTFNEAYRRLARHPRLIEPAMQLVDGPVYIHQFKINAKAAFDGDVWQWHQDYGTWARDDLMPEPRALNVALFLEPVSACNGPLLFIPRSHREGKLEAGHDLQTTSYPLWTLDKATVRRLAEEGGVIAPTGPAGTVLLFHCNLVHASPGNISPWDRTIVYISACHTANHIRRFQRPEWIAHRDFTAIHCLGDDCLAELTREAAE